MRTSGSLLARTSVLLVLLFAAAPEAYALCGTITASGGGIALSGAQTLTCNTTLTAIGSGGFIDFASTVDGGFALTTDTVGATTFAGAVGGTTPLTSLFSTFGNGGAVQLGGNVTTSGDQDYGGPVMLGSDVTLTSNGGLVAFTSGVDNASATARALTVNADTVTINGSVGDGANGPLSSLTSNSHAFSNDGDLTINGPLSITITAFGIFQTAGTFTVVGTSNFNAGSNAITLTNIGNDFLGTVTATGSSVSIADSSALNVGTITSASTLALNAVATSVSGTLSFGNGSTTGTVNGDYAQNGTLALHASASGNDQLAVSGNATLGGTLSVAFSNAPTVGQNFTVLTATGSVAGTFATVNVTGLSPGQVAAVTYNASSVVLTINAITPVTLQSFEVD